MAQINWGLLNRAPAIEDRFQQGLQFGAGVRQRERVGNALQTYAMNPDDPTAAAGVVQADPVLGMRIQEDQRIRRSAAEKQALEAQDRQRKMLLEGAKIIREVNPQDDASWQQARAISAQMGLPLDGVPESYDPNYIQQVIALADAIDPEKPDAREVVVVDGIVLDKATMKPVYESPYPRVVSGAGGVHIQPRVGIGGLQGGGAVPAGTVQAPELPPGWTFEDDGGPSPDGSGGF